MKKLSATFVAIVVSSTMLGSEAKAAPDAASGYAYGYGTYYVALRRNIPPNWGNASTWPEHARASGLTVSTQPAAGAIAWTDKEGLGLAHVAYVEAVDGDFVTVSEMFFHGNWGRVTFRTVPAYTFVYIS